MKRIAVLTGGGDAPGLNAVIRAVTKSAIQVYGWEVLGVRDGFDGFLKPQGVFPLRLEDVRGILPRGGTILGAANRGNPFARKVIREGKEVIEDVSGQVVQRIQDLNLDGLVVIGGDGTLHIALELFQLGVPVVGVPKTIDNDVGGTEVTFGFDTAVNIAMDAIDRLHTTAEAHHRVMVIELMGRDAGFIALQAGIAGGADVILIPEIPFQYERILEKIRQRIADGRLFSIVVVSEGAHPLGGEKTYQRSGDAIYAPRLGGVGYKVGEFLEAQGLETRVTVLGHLQRGGSPTAFDRWLASRFGVAAVDLIAQGRLGNMVALRHGRIVDLPLEEALREPKRVDLQGDGVRTARQLGICLGD